ncbi:hypothetical protein O3M35_009431 [Rhynocoris fuscipes]|uniref:Uncharacterized protein n=1 Tax=Rhynocoris fuscipes TaxID=488301 RepID=A0AAW1D3P6_9HEMI
MDQLLIKGKKIDIKTVKSDLNMSDFKNTPGFKRVYCITPPFGMKESTIKIQLIKNKLKKTRKKSQIRREERLQEILNSTVEVKRPPQKARPKYPLPVNTKLYPDYKIQSQIYSNRKLSLQQIRQIFFKTNEDTNYSEDLFDLSILVPFINTAFNRLYEENLQLLNQIIDEEKPNMKIEKEKPKLRIKDEYIERFVYRDDEDEEIGQDVDTEHYFNKENL